MQTLAAGVSYLDLHLQGRPRVVACGVLHNAAGVAIIDPGPSSTLPNLRRALDQSGIALSDVNALLLTHIHLDHAGAAGTLVAEHPALRVYVHENGARHLADPTKLVASATRLYGDAMDTLWGAVTPVPVSALHILKGGERIRAGGRDLEVAFTPGHASHHVSYFSADTGIAYVGDTAGVKLKPHSVALPPTPPPDIDLEAWHASLARIDAWRPATLFLTHFGPVMPAASHLEEFRDRLDRVATLARTSLVEVADARAGDPTTGDKDALREAWFKAEVMRDLRRQMSESDANAYEAAARFDLNWRGLARYWRKREGPPAAPAEPRPTR